MEPLNLLTTPLPDSLAVGGEVFPIQTDFRLGIRYEGIIRDEKLDMTGRVLAILRMLYAERVPRDLEAAFLQVIWYMQGGEETYLPHRKSAGGKNKPAQRVIDYLIDSKLIYAAFLDQYGVDLQDVEHLHWWKFRAMFAGLRDDHELVKIMGYRALNLAEIKDQKQRARLAKLKNAYALPSGVTTEQMADRAGAVFGGMG